jgi:hypothetical protein
MDNQDGGPQIIFPNVPDDFCPSGNWTDILQAFIDEVLANGTINVPGLGDVTPEEIQDINDELQDLQNQINALSGGAIIREGAVTTIGVGDNTYPVVFSSPMPDATYSVSITPRASGITGLTDYPTFLIQSGSKTASGFTIIVENGVSQITAVEWIAAHT